MARNPEVDLLHCGDADTSLPEVVSRIRSGEPMKGLRGMMWRDGDEIIYEGRAANFTDLDAAPTPDFDEYFRMRTATRYEHHPAHRRAMLPIETARGCWYGMKNHCTFCGLNRAGMDFRAKKPERVLVMLKELSPLRGARLQRDRQHPRAGLHFDGCSARSPTRTPTYVCTTRSARSSQPRPSSARCGAGGLTSVQPGIESFSTHVLTLMRKNTTGMRQPRAAEVDDLLRHQQPVQHPLRLPRRDRPRTIARRPRCCAGSRHLQPPYAIARARPDRGSPMFEQPEAHAVHGLRPSACYRHIYPPSYDLNRVSYFFEHDTDRGLPRSSYSECISLVADWKRKWASTSRPCLRMVKTWESVSIHDGRGDEYRGYRFDDAEAALYELCTDARGIDELISDLDCPVDWVQTGCAGSSISIW